MNIRVSADSLSLRPVRSFVRREGRITVSQQRHLDTLWETYGLVPTDTPLDLATVFGRQGPCWLEIGFGTGEFLADVALAHPEINLLGIEVHRPGVGHLLGRLQAQAITNVRVWCADGVEILRRAIPLGTLERVYLLFPDPWPKTRHHKRRLIQPDFVALLEQVMASGGQFHLATDWQPYAEQMLTVLENAPGWRNAMGVGGYAPRPEERQPTRFERRGQRLGHGVWDLLFIRE